MWRSYAYFAGRRPNLLHDRLPPVRQPSATASSRLNSPADDQVTFFGGTPVRYERQHRAPPYRDHYAAFLASAGLKQPHLAKENRVAKGCHLGRLIGGLSWERQHRGIA